MLRDRKSKFYILKSWTICVLSNITSPMTSPTIRRLHSDEGSINQVQTPKEQQDYRIMYKLEMKVNFLYIFS